MASGSQGAPSSAGSRDKYDLRGTDGRRNNCTCGSHAVSVQGEAEIHAAMVDEYVEQAHSDVSWIGVWLSELCEICASCLQISTIEQDVRGLQQACCVLSIV